MTKTITTIFFSSTKKQTNKSTTFFLLLMMILALPIQVMAQGEAAGDFLSTDAKGSRVADKLFSDSMPDPAAKAKWSGKAQAGLVSSSGNADNQSITAGILARHNKKHWLHIIGANLYFAENSGAKTAERYALSYKLKYGINVNRFAFNFATYETDKFSNIDSRISDVIGYGHQFLKNEKHNIETEIGIGVRNTQFIDNTNESNETVAHLALHYMGKLTATTTLSEDLTTQAGGDNVFTESVTALQIAMTEKLSLSLNFTVRNNTNVSAGVEKTDTITSINVVSNF